ncbi:hypothetical protein ACFX13_017532 [Malus domestica]
MGKSEANLQQQQQQQQWQTQEAQNSSGLICLRCSVVFSTIGRELSFRCIVVLILNFSILLSGIFWISHFLEMWRPFFQPTTSSSSKMATPPTPSPSLMASTTSSTTARM